MMSFTTEVVLRPAGTSLRARNACLRAPVAGQGTLISRHGMVSEGRTLPMNERPYVVDVAIGKPGAPCEGSPATAAGENWAGLAPGHGERQP